MAVRGGGIPSGRSGKASPPQPCLPLQPPCSHTGWHGWHSPPRALPAPPQAGSRDGGGGQGSCWPLWDAGPCPGRAQPSSHPVPSQRPRCYCYPAPNRSLLVSTGYPSLPTWHPAGLHHCHQHPTGPHWYPLVPIAAKQHPLGLHQDLLVPITAHLAPNRSPSPPPAPTGSPSVPTGSHHCPPGPR